jgi:hypothetical protein
MWQNHRHYVVVEGVRIHGQTQIGGLEIVHALDFGRGHFSVSQRGQQHARENRDYGDNHKEFDKGE